MEMKRNGKAVITVLACALAVFMALVCNACGKSDPAVSVKIIGKPRLNTVCVGESFMLSYTLSDENAKAESVVWDSSDKTVATVNSDGKVTAVSVGVSDINVVVIVFSQCDRKKERIRIDNNNQRSRRRYIKCRTNL